MGTAHPQQLVDDILRIVADDGDASQAPAGGLRAVPPIDD